MPMGRACMTVAGSTYLQARVFGGVTCAAAGSGAPADWSDPAARAAQHEAASSPAWASEGGSDCDAWLGPPDCAVACLLAPAECVKEAEQAAVKPPAPVGQPCRVRCRLVGKSGFRVQGLGLRERCDVSPGTIHRAPVTEEVAEVESHSPLCSGAFASLAGCIPRGCTSVQALAVFARTQGKQPDLSPRLVDGIIQSVLLRSAELRWIVASAA